MHPWHDIPNPMSTFQQGFNVVIEIPKGSKVKYELDKPSGILRVDRVLYSAVHYPANYGFLPRTYCDDKDPLDVLVLGNESVVPGVLMTARAIGVFRMRDQGELDDKIIAVHSNDPAFAEYEDVSQLPQHTWREMQRFFQDYKTLENKEVQVDEPVGVDVAHQVIREALELYQIEENRVRGWAG
jgi:inorganic pyrophosphatase